MTWRKSSFTHPDNCVEVAWPVGGVAVRDSKDPAGPALTVGRSALATLVATATGPRSVLSA